MRGIQGRNSRQDPGCRDCGREHRKMLFMSFLQCSGLATFLIQPSLACLGMLPLTLGSSTLTVNLGNVPQTWLHVNLMEIIPQLMFLLPRCVQLTTKFSHYTQFYLVLETDTGFQACYARTFPTELYIVPLTDFDIVQSKVVFLSQVTEKNEKVWRIALGRWRRNLELKISWYYFNLKWIDIYHL